jgi:hypothetical protein
MLEVKIHLYADEWQWLKYAIAINLAGTHYQFAK